MKKILIITFAYGITSSGKTTKRIAEGLAKYNLQVKVGCCLADKKLKDNNNIQIINASNWPISPARIFTFLGNLLKKDINYFFWEKRITKKLAIFINTWKPDFIYARSSPAVSFYVGNRLSKKFGIPLILHFADPIPATEEWAPKKSYREKMKKSVAEPIKNAKLLTFVTHQMLKYQESQTNLNLESKSIIVPNPIPEFSKIELKKKEKFVFAYLGKFGKTRNPQTILWGIDFLLKKNMQIEIWFVGSENERIENLIRNNPLLKKNVKIIPYTNDLNNLLRDINCLIDLDSDAENQVFLSNKLMEYLSWNRPVISITTKNSPAFTLLKTLNETTFTTDFKKKNIENTFLKVFNQINQNQIENYTERLNLIEKYSIQRIIGNLDFNMKNII